MTHRPQEIDQEARPLVLSHGDMLDRLNTVLYEQVALSVKKVYKQEKHWTEREMVKRIVRYIRKGADAKDIVEMPWQKGIEKFLDGVISIYSGSCQDRSWFYDLDLSQTLVSAAWVILKSCKAATPKYDEVCRFVEEGWHICLDETLHHKAMWISVEKVFHPNSKAQKKIFTSL